MQGGEGGVVYGIGDIGNVGNVGGYRVRGLWSRVYGWCYGLRVYESNQVLFEGFHKCKGYCEGYWVYC